MIEPLVSRDGKSILRTIRTVDNRKPLAKSVRKKAAATGKTSDGSALIVGFPGAGLVGSIAANYVIEKLQLRQIAFIDSDYVVPTVIYTGGKLRHPFRIYSNRDKSLYVMVCEAPIITHGINSIMDLVATWSLDNNVSEVVVLDGIPIRSLAIQGRKAQVFRSYQLISSGNIRLKNDIGNEARIPALKNAIITGLSAGVLEACISFDIACSGILIPATSGVPDPEASAIVLELVASMPNIPLNIDVLPLRKEGDKIKKQLTSFIEDLRAQGQSAEPATRPEPSQYLGESTIYG